MTNNHILILSVKMSSRPLKRKLTETGYSHAKKAKVAVRAMPAKLSSYRGLAKIVRKEIKRTAEKKVWIDFSANVPLSTAVGGVPVNKNLLPTLSQGTSNSNRVGNEITVVSGMTRGYVNILPYSITTNPLSTPTMVKMWLCYSKKLATTNLGNTDIATAFFDTNAGSAGFQGNMLDMILTANKDNWVILQERAVELGATYASSGGSVGTGGYFDNSKCILPFEFDFTKYVSRLMYDDTGTAPTNKNLFLVFQAVYADGSSSAIQPAELHIVTRVEYIDT